MTEWRQRAGETKKRRTREALVEAADALIRSDGINVTAEAVAREAGVGVATFYTVFPSRAAMFTEVFRELVSEPHRAAVEEVLEATARDDGTLPWPDQRRRVTDLVASFGALTSGRNHLVTGALMSRLSETPEPGLGTDWLVEDETGTDPVRDLAVRILMTLPIQAWTCPDSRIDARRLAALRQLVHQVALYLMDTASTGGELLPDSVADVLLGLFEVEKTIFDRKKDERRGLNPQESAALAVARNRIDKALSTDDDTS